MSHTNSNMNGEQIEKNGTRDEQNTEFLVCVKKLKEDIRKCIKAREPEPDKYIVKLHQAVIDENEILASMMPLLEDRVTMGKRVAGFEAEFGAKFGLDHTVMSNSGSSANLLALAALCSPALGPRLKEGDEVILPGLLWSTTIWPVIQMGLIPVIVDIDPETLNIDSTKIEEAICEKTKAIMIVHIFGNPCDMTTIMAIAEKHSLLVIEDCCEALGSLHRGQTVGSFGVVSAFSFYYSHHITSVEGGMNGSTDVEVADRMRIMRAHGWSRPSIHAEEYQKANPQIDGRWLFVDLGYNLRPTESNAAMGSIQLKRVEHVIGNRRQNGEYFLEALAPFSKYLSFQKTTPDCVQSWFYFAIIVQKDAPFTRNELVAFLEANAIETRPLLTGNILQQPAMSFLPHRIGAKSGSLPISDWITSHGFAIGCHSEMDEAIKSHVPNVIKKFMAKKNISV